MQTRTAIAVASLDKDLRPIVAEVQSGRDPAEWLVFEGRAQTLHRYLRGVFVALLVGFPAVGALVAAGGVCGGIGTGVAAGEAELALFGVATAIVVGAAFACMALLFVPHTIVFHLLVRGPEKNPRQTFAAVGPEGVIAVAKTLIGVRVSTIGWDAIQPPTMRGFNALGYLVHLQPGLMGWAMQDVFRDGQGRVRAVIAAGRELHEAGQRVTADAIRARVDPDRQAIPANPFSPVIRGGAAPEQVADVVDRLARQEVVPGVRVHYWNRTARSLGMFAALMLLGMPLIVPMFFAPMLFIAAMYWRGNASGWFLALLPEALVVRDGKGVTVVPWASIRRIAGSGRKVTVETADGPVPLTIDWYGLDGERLAALAEPMLGR